MIRQWKRRMAPGPRRRARGTARPAIMLVELIALIAIIIFVMIALTRLLLTQLDLHTIERQHHNRIAVMDGLLHRLRGDLVAGANWGWRDDGVLTVDVLAAGGVRRIRYDFARDHVTRTESSAQDAETETDAWSSHRLRFEAVVERGERGAILQLTHIEEPPERRRRLPDRTYVAALSLPPVEFEREGDRR
jgi:hypothetical protein